MWLDSLRIWSIRELRARVEGEGARCLRFGRREVGLVNAIGLAIEFAEVDCGGDSGVVPSPGSVDVRLVCVWDCISEDFLFSLVLCFGAVAAERISASFESMYADLRC